LRISKESKNRNEDKFTNIYVQKE